MGTDADGDTVPLANYGLFLSLKIVCKSSPHLCRPKPGLDLDESPLLVCDQVVIVKYSQAAGCPVVADLY